MEVLAKARKSKCGRFLIPVCPHCGFHTNTVKNFGAEDGPRYWFTFNCKNCTTKRKVIDVKYWTDRNLKLKKGGVENGTVSEQQLQL